MKRFWFTAAFLTALIFSPSLAAPALACSCGGLPERITGISTFAQAGSATLVFAGRPVSRDNSGVNFQVIKIWKGSETTEMKIFNGVDQLAGCGPDFAFDRQVIVLAIGSSERPQVRGCSTISPLSDTTVRELDVLLGPHNQIADEVQPCTGMPELRIHGVRTDKTPIAGVQIVIENGNQRASGVSNSAGEIAFSHLAEGEYKITAFADALDAKSFAVHVSTDACTQATLFLLKKH